MWCNIWVRMSWLSNLQPNVNIFNVLERIAIALERIANHFDLVRGGSSAFITKDVDVEKDGSKVLYVDDVEQFIREQKRARYMEETGRVLADWEDPPAHGPQEK